MKRLIAIIVLLIGLLPSPVYANGAGLPSFFEINGKYTYPNPLQIYGITASSFLIPQDFAPDNYIVNQPINFKVDDSILSEVITAEDLKTTKFAWNFGDGTKGDGLQNTHTYTKMGTYILVLTIDIYTSGIQTPTEFIDSYLINVLPYSGYKDLPQAVIKINEAQMSVPNYQQYWQDENFTQPLSFDASASKHTGAPLVSYLWNFGDGNTSTKESANHSYDSKKDSVTVVLRVKDKNGFFSDTYVGLRNNPNVSVRSATTSNSPFILVVIILGIIVLIFFLFKKFRKQPKTQSV